MELGGFDLNEQGIMNRAAFFAALRGGTMFPKDFKVAQVDGTEAILERSREARGVAQVSRLYPRHGLS